MFDIMAKKLLDNHMNALEELRERVDEESITLIQMVGVPRSMSTALGRSLNETELPSVYVNEPFNRDNMDIEIAARFILDAYEAHIPTDTHKGLIVTKNMASYMTDTALKGMESVASVTIWNIRHPYIQIGSLLTRIVNDLRAGPGEDRIAQADIGPYLPEACDYLLNSPKSLNFSKTGWETIGRHAETATDTTRLSVDSHDYIYDTVSCLKSICTRIGLPYSASMHTGWKHTFVNVVNRDNLAETERSAWTQQAAQSVGVLTIERQALDVETLPESLQEHITSVALPVYERLRTLR